MLIRENEAQVQEDQNNEDVQDFVRNQNVEKEECIYCPDVHAFLQKKSTNVLVRRYSGTKQK